MSDAIGPGDWVECIIEPNKGMVLYVEDVRFFPGRGAHNERACKGGIGLLIRGWRASVDDGYYCACAFRPLPRSSHIESLLTSLKTPAKEKQHERV